MNDISRPEYLEHLVRLFKEVIFPSNYVLNSSQTTTDSDELHRKACEQTNQFICDEILSFLLKTNQIKKDKLSEKIENGSRLLLEPFQYPILNKNVTFNFIFIIKLRK
jgi:hypothetical protein